MSRIDLAFANVRFSNWVESVFDFFRVFLLEEHMVGLHQLVISPSVKTGTGSGAGGFGIWLDLDERTESVCWSRAVEGKSCAEICDPPEELT